ncbi:hypothetical protein AVEN_162961-1 [Araneus ventricosus]|uniref:Uncharacterized protein n=1 Tax=Araneus ventricosus TaxID=182803 RepID=A0A4Y2BZC3_ARAVE|nr:hypothetical protein AVEN_162961-1 [Araneus ventricosus]
MVCGAQTFRRNVGKCSVLKEASRRTETSVQFLRAVADCVCFVGMVCLQWRFFAQALVVLTSCLDILRVPQNLFDIHPGVKPTANLLCWIRKGSQNNFAPVASYSQNPSTVCLVEFRRAIDPQRSKWIAEN